MNRYQDHQGDKPMTDASIDLAFIERVLERLTTELMTLRDDIAVLTAITMRLDGSQTALLTELSAMHAEQTH